MKPEAVIFDLDGTLVDSIGDIADLMNDLLSESGYPLYTYDQYKQLVGKGLLNLAQNVIPSESKTPEKAEILHKKFCDEYGKRCINTTKAYPGINELLIRLKKKNIFTAVLSNKAHKFTAYMVSELFPENTFNMVLGVRKGIPGKPDPASALEIAGESGIAPDKFYLIGDSGTDMKTAKNAGMIPAGVLWGYRDKTELLENGAQILFSHPDEIKI